MDIHMPVMDGLECSKKIRETPSISKTVIIGQSGNADNDIM